MSLSNQLSFVLVDDSRVDLKMFSKLLELSGVASEVITFLSSTEALDFFKRANYGQEKMPDVVIVDLQMPELNGFELLDEMQMLGDQLFSKTRTLMLSSTLAQSDHQKAMEHPMIEVLLQKPLDIDELKSVLESPPSSVGRQMPMGS